MNMCLIYAPAYAVMAFGLARVGHPWAARAMCSKAMGMATLAPFVAWSEHWALFGSLIWLAVAVDLTGLAEKGKIRRIIPVTGYALIVSYWLNYLDSFFTLPVSHVPTWVSAAIGVAMAVLICGPAAHDMAQYVFDKLVRGFHRRGLRRSLARRVGGDLAVAAPNPGAASAGRGRNA